MNSPLLLTADMQRLVDFLPELAHPVSRNLIRDQLTPMCARVQAMSGGTDFLREIARRIKDAGSIREPEDESAPVEEEAR